MKCPECDEPIEADWDECPYCEAVLPKCCPQCGREVNVRMKKCPGCKTRLQGTDTDRDTPPPVGPDRDAPAGASPGPTSGIVGGDVGMLKGNISVDQSRQEVHYHGKAPGQKEIVTATGNYCPLCHRLAKDDHFFCPACQRKYICVRHQDAATRLCEECAERKRMEELARTGEIEPGMVLGERYEIAEFLGEGGMGRVFLALDRTVGKPFALKFLPPEVSRDEEALDNLRKEMQVAMELTDPNIVRLFDLVHVDRLRFLKMEYVEGSTLGQLLKQKQAQGRTFTMKELLPIVEQTCRALDAIHEAGVVHRDLKPGNVMVTVRGQVKIMDLGIARVIRDSVSKVSLKAITGTPAYMSPEQISGKGRIDGRSDQYSLACMVYELLSGKPPFHTGEIPYQHLYTAPEPLEGADPWVSEALLTALAKQPDERYASAAEFYEELTGGPWREREEERERKEAEAQREREEGERKQREAEEKARKEAEAKARREEERRRKEAEEKARRDAEEKARREREELERKQRAEEARRKREPKVYTDWPFDEREAKRRQQETAEALGLPVELEVDAGKGVKMTFALIPAGQFMMGSPEDEKERRGDESLHKVTLSKPFYMGKYQVTQAQWQAVVGQNPSDFKGDQNPVESVSWDDCQEFLKKLHAQVHSS